MPQIEVTFDIDANGILHVSARDKATTKEQKIRIEASSGLSKDEIDRMVKDAERNASDDKARREEIDTRNRLDSLAYEVEKNSKEWADRLGPDMKSRLEAAVDRARKAHRGADMGEVRAALEELTNAYQEAGRSLYSQASTAPGGEGTPPPEGAPTGEPAGGTGEAKPEDVVEADYEIVDDSSKK
jgi:molecular chaperone DnaK